MTVLSSQKDEELPPVSSSHPANALSREEMAAVASMTTFSSDDTLRQQQQQHWQQQVAHPSPSTSILSRASKLGSDTYTAAKRFTGDHIHVPRIPYISSSSPRLTTSSSSSVPSSSTSTGEPHSLAPSRVEDDAVLDREPSLRPFDHRERTALHALKDTFVLPTIPNPASFIPHHLPLPSIPCMGGLGQSNIFADPPDIGDQDVEAEKLAAGATATGKDPFKRLSGNVMMIGGYRGSEFTCYSV